MIGMRGLGMGLSTPRGGLASSALDIAVISASSHWQSAHAGSTFGRRSKRIWLARRATAHVAGGPTGDGNGAASLDKDGGHQPAAVARGGSKAGRPLQKA